MRLKLMPTLKMRCSRLLRAPPSRPIHLSCSLHSKNRAGARLFCLDRVGDKFMGTINGASINGAGDNLLGRLFGDGAVGTSAGLVGSGLIRHP